MEFKINSPEHYPFSEIEFALENYYSLKEVIIVPIQVNSEDFIKAEIGKSASSFLTRNIRANDIIGVSWSSTVLECAKHLKTMDIPNITIAQLNGSMDIANYSTQAAFIMEKIACAFLANSSTLSAPMIVDSAKILQTFLGDTRIRSAFELTKCTSVALFGIGSINNSSSLYRTGYIDDAILKRLENKNAAGDICGHFIDIYGELCDQELESRTLAIPKEYLQKMRLSIALAGGEKKLDAIEAALLGKWCNVLITDEFTGKALLEKSLNSLNKVSDEKKI